MIIAYVTLLLSISVPLSVDKKIEKPIEKSITLVAKQQKIKYINIPTEWVKRAKKPN